MAGRQKHSTGRLRLFRFGIVYTRLKILAEVFTWVGGILDGAKGKRLLSESESFSQIQHISPQHLTSIGSETMAMLDDLFDPALRALDRCIDADVAKTTKRNAMRLKFEQALLKTLLWYTHIFLSRTFETQRT